MEQVGQLGWGIDGELERERGVHGDLCIVICSMGHSGIIGVLVGLGFVCVMIPGLWVCERYDIRCCVIHTWCRGQYRYWEL